MVLATFFEGSEITLNGLEVGGIRGEKQNARATSGDQFAGFGAFVESGIIQDHDMLRGEQRTERPSQSGVKDGGVAGASKKERAFQAWPDPGGEQGRARPFLPGDQTRDPLLLGRICMAAAGGGFESAFIHID